MSDEPRTLGDQLALPFAADEVKWKPVMVKGDAGALPLATSTSCAVMDRLDRPSAPWDGRPRTTRSRTVWFADSACYWAASGSRHEDVGLYSEQPDDGDKVKAAFRRLEACGGAPGIGRLGTPHPAYRVPVDRPSTNARSSARPLCLPGHCRRPFTSQTRRESDAGHSRPAGQKGLAVLELAWRTISADMREACRSDLAELKARQPQTEPALLPRTRSTTDRERQAARQRAGAMEGASRATNTSLPDFPQKEKPQTARITSPPVRSKKPLTVAEVTGRLRTAGFTPGYPALMSATSKLIDRKTYSELVCPSCGGKLDFEPWLCAVGVTRPLSHAPPVTSPRRLEMVRMLHHGGHGIGFRLSHLALSTSPGSTSPPNQREPPLPSWKPWQPGR